MLRVTQLDGFGSNIVVSAPPAAPANTAAPVISGTTIVGSTLSTTDGTWTGSPTPTYAYQWKRGGTSISGATASSYLLVTADLAATITVVVTATNTTGSASATSSGVGPIAAAPVAPVNTAVPVISGTATVGQTLTTTNGAWTGSPTPTFTYQWKRGGVNISGATSSSYLLVSADLAATITATVTATNSAGSASATSTGVGPIAAAPIAPVNTVVPVISGTTTVGSTLTTTDGTWTGSPTPTYTYQWKRGGTNISGATSSSYLLVTADIGATITVTVTATNTAGSASATSTGVGPVTAAWSPASLTGLIGWWDASVTASLSLTGSAINSVADQSGAGNNLTGVVTKPTYNAAGFNSRPAFMFAGATASGLLQNTNFTGPGGAFTWWYVGVFSGSTAGGTSDARAMSYAAPSQPDYGLNGTIIYRSGTANTSLNLFREGVVATAAVALTANHRIIVSSDSSGAATIYVNGVAVATGTKGLTVTTGGILCLGSAQGSNYWDGSIAEAGIATGYSDATTVAQLDSYLKTKWGL